MTHSRGQQRCSLLTSVVSGLELDGPTRQMWGPWQATLLITRTFDVYQMRCPPDQIRASQKLQKERFEGPLSKGEGK